MLDLPKSQLNPNVKSVWRINDAIWILLGYACVVIPFAVAASA